MHVLPAAFYATCCLCFLAFVEFDAKTVDAILERLTILRAQMLPRLPAPNKRI